MTYFVAVDVGCIECGEDSAVLGIFTERKNAEAVCKDAAILQEARWRGQHRFEVFEVEELNDRRIPNYKLPSFA
jgi:hypothetical protein